MASGEPLDLGAPAQTEADASSSGTSQANTCRTCGKPIPALTLSCSRECALAHWKGAKFEVIR